MQQFGPIERATVSFLFLLYREGGYFLSPPREKE